MVEAPTAQALQKAKVVIMEAINKKKMEPVINIVRHGFPVNEPIIYGGVNLLMHAAGNCNEADLALIMTLEPDVTLRDNLGRTALHFACRSGNMGTFKILNDHCCPLANRQFGIVDRCFCNS